ncbi:hypothetical protein [Thermococcus sp. 5-4]|uniref:hypothetical protein n=1 Tax=Thermococcus sp. 5-4 TaxID=2008440 RepID=UPI000B49CA6D|nr:hypothetical protein [Thermococcus sp. 5-4]ASA77843.1 hypothetical protein CDI07_05900 [Thermococcus sp. 5-4]
MKKKAVAGLVLVAVLSLGLFLFFRGILIPVEAERIYFGDDSGFRSCPPSIKITSQYYENHSRYFVNFTISTNSSSSLEFSLEGVIEEHVCIPEGIVLYTYYPGDWAGINAALVDYSLNTVWKRHFQAFPVKYHNGELLLTSSCIYFVNASTGDLSREICPGVARAQVPGVKILGDETYFTVVHYSVFTMNSQVHIYRVKDGKREEALIVKMDEHLLGARAILDVSEEYVAVAYYLRGVSGAEKNGLCVFERNTFRKISCRELKADNRPLEVKLRGDVVYLQTTKGLEVYRILTLSHP